MENDGNEFTKQFVGSASANVVFMVGILIYKFIEGRCKHSRCSSTSSCLKCAVDNYDTERADTNNKIDIAQDAVQLEISVQDLQTRNHKFVQEKHIETLELRSPRPHSRDPKHSVMALGEDIV